SAAAAGIVTTAGIAAVLFTLLAAIATRAVLRAALFTGNPGFAAVLARLATTVTLLLAGSALAFLLGAAAEEARNLAANATENTFFLDFGGGCCLGRLGAGRRCNRTNGLDRGFLA